MNIYFDGSQIDYDKVTGLSYDSKLINDNDVFELGQTICNSATLKVDKSLTTQPSVVTIEENGITNEYNVDNIQEDDTSYIYTLVDNMVNFNFRYDAQPLIEASEHTETDGTKYVTLLELVQDICDKANVTLATTDFTGYDKHITWYDNTITAREYIGMVAELNGGYALIDEGLVFKKLTNGEVKSITGKNLFDKTAITDNSILIENGTLQGNANAYVVSDFVPIKPNTAYYKTTTGTPRTKYYDKNKQPLNTTTYQDISIGSSAGTFTTPNNAYYLRITIYKQTGIDSVMVNEGSTALPYEPYENPNITIQDGTETSLVGCNIEGNTTQQTYTGKNLINNIATTQSVTGVTFTRNNDGSISLSGTNTGSSVAFLQLTSAFNLTAGTYALSSGIGINNNVFIRVLNASDWSVPISTQFVNDNIKTINNMNVLIYLYVNPNTNVDGIKIYPQLEKSSSVTSYEPYVGGIASPNPDYPQEVEVVETYNLFNIGTSNNDYLSMYDAVPSASIVSINDKVFSCKILASGETCYYRNQKLKSNKTYTISTTFGTTKGRVFIRLRNLTDTGYLTSSDVTISGWTYNSAYKGWWKSVTDTQINVTLTIPNCLYWQYGIGYDTNAGLDTTQTIYNVQIIEGSKILPYIPYNNIAVNVIGKNLYAFNDISGTITNDYFKNVLLLKNFEPNTTYSVSFNANVSVTPFIVSFGYGDDSYYRADMPNTWFANQTNGNLSFTITTGTSTYANLWIKVPRYSSTTTTTYSITNIQVEKSSSSTNYAPYSNITTPIDLQGNFIGKIGSIKDELNIDDLGNVILTKRIGKTTLNGSETWSNQNGTFDTANRMMFSYSSEPVFGKGLANRKGLCNYFINYPSTMQSATTDVTAFNFHQQAQYSHFIYVKIDKSALSTQDVSGFQNWLSSHNMIVYFQLVESYQVNLGKANIELNEGVNYITFLTGLDTRNSIEYTSQNTEYTIDIDDCESYNIGEYHKITRVAMENGAFNPVGEDEGNTIYLNPNNVFITEQSDLDNIYHITKGFEYYSLEIKKGNIDIIPTGICIALVKDNEIYKTYNQLELNYNGDWGGTYHFITGSNKQEETFSYNGIEDNYKRLKFQLDRDKNQVNILIEQTNTLEEKTNIMSTNIDTTTGDVREVTTTTGFTFNADGLNIYKNDTTFNTQINNIGTYYKDGDTILSQTTKDGTKTKDLDVFGYYRYGEDDINDEPMFIAVKYTDGNNEEGYGHFYNG